jgi:3-hydroxyacyl-CoA dehydrogenase
MTVDYDVQERVAIITISNPPVNALGWQTREELLAALHRAEDDTKIGAIIVAGAGSIFSAGADIRELDTPRSGQWPSLQAVIEAIELCEKPVVAALAGYALGGGLEIALGAHYRVAMPDTLIGFPEVKLGLLPGAGGTQRLPRVVNLETAVNMILSGQPVRAQQQARERLIDQWATHDLLGVAIAFANNVSVQTAGHPKVRDRSVEHPRAEAFIGFVRSGLRGSADGSEAQRKCLDAIEAAVRMPFEAGLSVERDAFSALLHSTHSRGLRHAFLAERATTQTAAIKPARHMRDIQQVAVVGAGTMGIGISMCLLNAGIEVLLLDTQADALERAEAAIRASYQKSVVKGKLSSRGLEERVSLLRPTLSYADLREADLVIEAVFEDYAAKQAVFGKLDEVVKPAAILATNTSTLDVNRIAAFTRRPSNVLGTHFFSPANVMRLLEIVRGAQTGEDVLATLIGFARRIGKVAVVAGVCDGFIGNRMLEQYLRQAGFLLEEGALPEQIDRAIERFGFAMGPFRMGDLAGNDIGWAIRRRRAVEQPGARYSTILDEICKLGRFGQKSGAGVYDYKPGSRAPIPSTQVNELIVRSSEALGIQRREIGDQEIVERLVFALINEGARILEEGIAARASDIDVVFLSGYGFPAYRGGPMFYADTVSAGEVLRAVRKFSSGYCGEVWQAAPMLKSLAETGGRFIN